MIPQFFGIIALIFLTWNPIMENLKELSIEKASELLKSNGLFQGVFIASIPTLINVIYAILVWIFLNIRFNLKITSDIKNEYYATDFSLIYFDENKNEETKDFCRKLKILIKIEYYNKICTRVILFLFKNLYIYYEIERDDISLRSRDRNAIETQKGIKYSLNNLLDKHIIKNSEGSYETAMHVLLSFEKNATRNNEEDEYIYPRILKKNGKESIIAKIFIKKELKKHRIKIIIKKKEK